MPRSSYLDAIDAKIATLELDLAAHKKARQIIVSLGVERNYLAPPKKKGPAEPLRQKIRDYLASRGAVPSRDIIRETGARDSAVWSALANMRTAGEITYDRDARTYTMIREAGNAAA